MDKDKFTKYYPLVDCFIRKKNFQYYYDDKDDEDEVFLFKLESPLEIAVLMNYLRFIITDMCNELGDRETVEKEIKKIQNNPDDLNNKKYKYKKVSLSELFKANYTFLSKNVIIRSPLVPNEEAFNKNFSRPDVPNITCPFSLKEFYLVILPRAINILINNYYSNL